MRVSRFFSLLFFFVFTTPAFAQLSLHHSINNGLLPAAGDSIAPVVPYIDSTGLFQQSGYQACSFVPDFVLYDTAAQPLQLSSLLAQGKPVLLASVSLTCPIARKAMTEVLADLWPMFANQIEFVLVYTIDAHPVTPDFSPYSDTVFTTQVNYNDSILCRQPRTYGERRKMAARFQRQFQPHAHVVVDGPENEFWRNFGPAPNNAYLIAPNGMIFRTYGRMGFSQFVLEADIPLLLNSVGVPEAPLEARISVFPNPGGKSIVHVETPGMWSLYIFDTQGRNVATRKDIESQDAELERYHLKPGVYALIVQTGAGCRNLRYVQE
jgi:hypothetical protein